MKSIRRLVQILICGMILFPTFALSSSGWGAPPTPPDKAEAFNSIKNRLEKQKEEASRLQELEKKEQKKLTELQHSSVLIGRNIQQQESLLEQLATKIQQNQTRQIELEHILDENRVQLAKHLSAAIRMRRIPAETLLLQANSPITTAQTALILQEAIPGIQTHMQKVSMAANELLIVQNTLLDDKKLQETTLRELRNEERKLAALIDERQELIKKTRHAYELTQKDVEELTAQSRSLQELVSKIGKINEKRRREEEEKQQQYAAAHIPAPAPVPSPRTPTSRIPSTGWPAAGVITVHYGENDLYGAPSQGIKIGTRPSALVTTPIAGTVRYAGEFKNYGQLVIIEHAGGWHSLIAGLHEIKALVGQSLQSGEPVGHMSTQKKQPVLYYELRYNGKPVNPAKKIKELS